MDRLNDENKQLKIEAKRVSALTKGKIKRKEKVNKSDYTNYINF